MGQVAHHAHIVLENSRLFDRIKNLSMRDSLTELYNHRHSIELLGNELHRVGRYEGGLGVLMVDVDDFKAVNDAHGHQVGDQVLKEISRRLRDTLRTVDSLGRYGGEEFLAILPHTAPEDARQTAERLRRAIGDEAIHAGGRELSVTVSIGVASYPGTAETPDALIREADAALYRAKQAGRNRVE
jgi:diguanylate cyclase (GGDEF)-like protein